MPTSPSTSLRSPAVLHSAPAGSEKSAPVQATGAIPFSRLDDVVLKRFEHLFAFILAPALKKRDEELGSIVRLSDRNLVMASVSQALFEAYRHVGVELSVEKLPANIDVMYAQAARLASVSIPFKNLKERKDLDKLVDGKLDLQIHRTIETFHAGRLVRKDGIGLALSDAWRMSIDPLKVDCLQRILGFSTDNPLFPFVFDTDTGYLHGMSRAWNFALDNVAADGPTDLALVKQLHRLSMMSDRDEEGKFDGAATGFHMARNLGFTKAGALELREFAQEMRKLLWPHYSVEASKDDIEAAFRKGISDRDFDAWLSNADIDNLDVLHLIRPRTSEEVLSFITGFWLDEYHRAPKESTEEKLFAIVDVCQKLERTHPYSQGNNRLFCVLLLNVLLLKNDLPMSMVTDPNMFDGFSTQEMMEKVREGWLRVASWKRSPTNR